MFRCVVTRKKLLLVDLERRSLSRTRKLNMEEALRGWEMCIYGAVVSCLTYLLFRRLRRTSPYPNPSPLRVHAIRLKPGQEIKSSILKYCADHSLDAIFVITCVGSLSRVHLRYAYPEGDVFHENTWSRGARVEKPMEILSMVGTIADKGASCHLHVSLGDDAGRTIGGHLIGDAIVATTAEIVLGQCEALSFKREHDARTGFGELVVRNLRSTS